MKYWLLKTEPDVFSFDDLINCKNKTDHWDGIRNYQARNFLRDDIKKGDHVLIYHSNAKPPGVAGVAEVTKSGYPDHTAFDPKEKYYDPKSDPENPRWYMVDVKATQRLENFISLNELKADEKFEDMVVVSRGRLSVQPVSKKHFNQILKLGKVKKI